MQFFRMLQDFNTVVILKYIIVDLLIGIAVGFILKQAIKINANRTSNLQVISAKDYTSSYFGKNFPKHAFDIFQLSPEFVVLQSANDQVISEDFYTFLGSSTKAQYENEEYRGHGYSALSSPVYLCTVVLPIAIGFFPALLPFVGKAFSPLLYSGMGWMFLEFLAQPLFGMLAQTSSNQE
jgi:hypothetical protein